MVAKTLRCFPQQSSWDVDRVIPHGFSLSEEFLQKMDPEIQINFVRLLARDVYSEGDSLPLYEYVMARRDEMSPEFVAMLNPWLEDERKHYEALRRCYHAVSGVSYEQMDECFNGRVHEIDPIEAILRDEFTMLVALAFDEIGSTISYRRDLREFYSWYGPQIARVGKHLVADEGIHFSNALRILQTVHPHRIEEVESLLWEIDRLEKGLGRYCKTFFLDHAQEQFRFPQNFNEVIIQLILARLGRAEYPKEADTLWLWKPEGCHVVPMVQQ